MTRYELEMQDEQNDKSDLYVSRVPWLKADLAGIGLPFSVDNELLFWEQHFDPAGRAFATYGNGHVKGGTLRYKAGHARIPAFSRLKVYESGEHKAGAKPRAIVHIPRITVCEARELSATELASDGFEDHDHMIASMRKYYPDITLDSIVSFYTFGHAFWERAAIEHYLHAQPHVE